MTVVNTTRLVTHTGNDVATVFAYGFEVPDASHLTVTLIDRTTLAETVLTPSQFTAAGIGVPAGGTITYPITGTPIDTNTDLQIKRTVPYLQNLDINNQGGFFAEPLESELDLIVMQIQQQVEELSRAPKFREGSSFSDVTLPDPEAGKILGETATGYENLDPNTLFPGVTDATGPFADRSTYDAQAEGFRFLATDLSPPLLYIRETAVAGTWSPGIPWGRGPQGDAGLAVKDAVYVPGTMVIEYDSNTLPSNAFLWANFETIGDVGSGADHESADYFDAFTNLKNSVWNVGTEDWDAGDVVRVPDRRGLMVVGGSTMGGAAQVVRVQRATTIDTTNLSTTITVADLTGVAVGMYVLGNANVPSGATIISINGGAGTAVISAAATGTASTVATRFSVISDPNSAGSIGGSDYHEQIALQLAQHTHVADAHSHEVKWDQDTKQGTGGPNTADSVDNHDGGGNNANTESVVVTLQNTGEGQPMPTLPPLVVINYIIYVAAAQVGPTIVPLSVGDKIWEWAGTGSAGAPGDGKISTDAALSSGGAAEIYIDNEDAAGLDLSAITSNFGTGDIITLYNLTRRGKFWQATVTETPTTPAGYVRNNNLTYGADNDGAGFVIGDQIALSIERTGAAGAAGPAGLNPGLLYTFDASTSMADPGAGDLRLNHATPASATAIAIHETSADTGNPSVAALIARWDDSTNATVKGVLLIKDLSAPENFVEYEVTALTDNGDWVQLTVQNGAGAGTLAGTLSVEFSRAGDGGAAVNSFETISAPSGTNPVAESGTDTLTLAVGGAYLSITGDSGADSLTWDLNINAATDLGSPAIGDEMLLGDIDNSNAIRKADIASIVNLADHDALTNFVADKHVAHASVTLTAGAGLTGGGTIAASRTFDVDINGTTDLPAPAVGDEMLLADISNANAIRKADIASILDLISFSQVNSVLAAANADIAVNSQKITGLAAPTNDGDAATKAYVDAVAAALDWKDAVRCATTGNITLSGEQTIDGILTSSDRVLVRNQSSTVANGIYVSSSGAWSRAADSDTTAKFNPGAAVFVEEGTTFGDTGHVMIADEPFTLGVNAVIFSQFTSLGQVTAGAGLTKSGSTMNVGAGTGITANADDVALADMADATIKGRASGAGTGSPSDLSAAQVRTIVGSATEELEALVELATDAEAQTGTDTARAITPANLASVTSTDTRAGLVEKATTAEVRNQTAEKGLTADNIYDAAAEASLSDAASIALNLDNGINFTVTLAGNRTLANPTNDTPGKTGHIRVVQDATGSRTLAFGTQYEFAGGLAPVMSTDANAEDLLFYKVLVANRIFISHAADIS